MKKYLLLFVPIILVLANGCNKINGHTILPAAVGGSTGSTGSTGGSGSAGSNGSQGAAAAVDTSKGYLPAATNTFWKYAESGNFTDTLLQTVTGTTTIGGLLYSVIASQSNLNGSQTGYMSGANHQYTLRDQNTIPGTVIQVLYFKDNVALGSIWTSPASASGTISGFPAQVSGKVVAYNQTKTVSGKTYNNVAHSNVQLQYDMGAGYMTYATYDYYIAKGVGIIQIDSSVGFAGAGSFATSSVLIAYSVK